MASDFYERVYAIVRLIPRGRVTSYGAIAQYLGMRGGARTVGYALNALGGLPYSPRKRSSVPAHRVVNSKGLLTGKVHFGSDVMEQLLRAEGIEVVKDQVQDYDRHYWNPNAHLPESF